MAELTFSECVRQSLEHELKEDDVKTLPIRLAERMRDTLHREGYAVHRVSECVRPGPPPGRPMTDEQMALVGIKEGNSDGI